MFKRFDYIWKDVKDDRGLSEIHDFFIDNFSNKEYDLSYENDIGDFLDLLSRLSKENIQLKQEIKQYWKCRDKWKQEAKELKKENEQLKAKVKRLQDIATRTEEEKEHYADLYCKLMVNEICGV